MPCEAIDDTPKDHTRREFIKGLVTNGVAMAATESQAWPWDNNAPQSKATPTLTVNQLVKELEELRFKKTDGKADINPLALQQTLKGQFITVTVGYGGCVSQCPTVYAKLSELQKKNPNSKILNIGINLSLDGDEFEKTMKMADKSLRIVTVHAPPPDPSKIASTIQKRLGFLHNSADAIIGHSPEILLFAPDGTLLTANNKGEPKPIDANDPKSLDSLNKLISNHQATSRGRY